LSISRTLRKYFHRPDPVWVGYVDKKSIFCDIEKIENLSEQDQLIDLVNNGTIKNFDFWLTIQTIYYLTHYVSIIKKINIFKNKSALQYDKRRNSLL